MARKATRKQDDPAQAKRFIEAAKAAGPSVGDETFERAFAKIAKHKPEPSITKSK